MTNQLTFSLREYRPTDAHQVVKVINENTIQSVGVKQAVVDAVGNVRLARYVPPHSKKVVVLNAHNEIVGYAYFVTSQYPIYEVGGAVAPTCWGRGIGSMLVSWSQQQAMEQSQYAPRGIRTLLQVNLYDSEQEAIQLFTNFGFKKAREWIHLVIELDLPPPLPKLPNDLLIRNMDLDNDWERVGPAMDDAFANHWGAIKEAFVAVEEEAEPNNLPEDESYSNTPGFCFVAVIEAEVVGGILCNAKLVERVDTGRVGSLFVRLKYQRHGIGRALMQTAFATFWKHGIKRIITDTDSESFSETPKFYSNLGMQLYRREYLCEKEIRPGREIRKLES